MTLAFCIIEFVGARVSGSLSLLADATHMLTDLSALGLALFASWMAAKRATPRMSFGFYRYEILAALVNGAALLTLSVFIVKEAFVRLEASRPIHTPIMIVVASAGLAVNVLIGILLRRHSKENINLRGAFFHVVADALSSGGAIVAGILIARTGWQYFDALASFFIAGLILISAWKLLRDVVEVLLEATPAHIDLAGLEKKILSVPGVQALHDLHIWSISSGKESLSAHLEVADGMNADRILDQVNEILSREFGIGHTTIQIEAAHKKRAEGRHFHQ